jgi:hypothetical protein
MKFKAGIDGLLDLFRSEEGSLRRHRQEREHYLAVFETEIGKRLPQDFRDYMISYDGKPIYDNTADVVMDDNPDRVLYSFVIYKLLFPNPSGTEDLRTNWALHRESMPVTLLPIAYDRFRNLMCLDPYSGAIYFWDLQSRVELPPEEQARRQNLYRVAPNFDKFMDDLYRFRKLM